MIIRSSKVNFIQVLLSISIIVIFWQTAPFYIKTDNLDLIRSIICVLVFFVFKLVFWYLNIKFLGKKVAVVANGYIQIDNKKYKWESIVRWNVSSKVSLSFHFGLRILNLFLGIITRTVLIQTIGKNIVIYDAPRKLVKCLAKNTNTYDSDFIISQSYKSIL